jgi:hypothetical protein
LTNEILLKRIEEELVFCYPSESMKGEFSTDQAIQRDKPLDICNGTTTPCCSSEGFSEVYHYANDVLSRNAAEQLPRMIPGYDAVDFGKDITISMKNKLKAFYDRLLRENKLMEAISSSDPSITPHASMNHILREERIDSVGKLLQTPLAWQTVATEHIVAVCRVDKIPFHIVCIHYEAGSGKTNIIASSVARQTSIDNFDIQMDFSGAFVLWEKPPNELMNELVKLGKGQKRFEAQKVEPLLGLPLTGSGSTKTTLFNDKNGGAATVFKISVEESSDLDRAIDIIKEKIEKYVYIYSNPKTEKETPIRIVVYIDEAHLYFQQSKKLQQLQLLAQFISDINVDRTTIRKYNGDSFTNKQNVCARFIFLSATLGEVQDKIEDFANKFGTNCGVSVLNFKSIPIGFRPHIFMAPVIPSNFDVITKVETDDVNIRLWSDNSTTLTIGQCFHEALYKAAQTFKKNLELERPRYIKQVFILPTKDDLLNKFKQYFLNQHGRIAIPPGNTVDSKNEVNRWTDKIMAWRYGSIKPGDEENKTLSIGFCEDPTKDIQILQEFGRINDFDENKHQVALGGSMAYKKKKRGIDILVIDNKAIGISLAGVSHVYMIGQPQRYDEWKQTLCRSIRIGSSVGFTPEEQTLTVTYVGFKDAPTRTSKTNDYLLNHSVDTNMYDGADDDFINDKPRSEVNDEMILAYELNKINFKSADEKFDAPVLFVNNPKRVLLLLETFVPPTKELVALYVAIKDFSNRTGNKFAIAKQLLYALAPPEYSMPFVKVGIRSAKCALDACNEGLQTVDNFLAIMSRRFEVIPDDLTHLSHFTVEERLKTYFEMCAYYKAWPPFYTNDHIKDKLVVCERNVDNGGYLFNYFDCKELNMYKIIKKNGSRELLLKPITGRTVKTLVTFSDAINVVDFMTTKTKDDNIDTEKMDTDGCRSSGSLDRIEFVRDTYLIRRAQHLGFLGIGELEFYSVNYSPFLLAVGHGKPQFYLFSVTDAPGKLANLTCSTIG